MSAEIIIPRQKVEFTEYELTFCPVDEDIHKPWYGFKCDKNGRVDITILHPTAVKNYLSLKSNPEYKSVLEHYTKSYIENATAKCKCGTIFELYDDYQGACRCPSCFQWYNMFGQELKDPTNWYDFED